MHDVMMMVNGKELSVPEGGNLLDVLLGNGIFVPHLCHMAGCKQTGYACRLCFVQVRGAQGPVCACEIEVADGMEVSTESSRCRDLARRALSLLAQEHVADCAACPRRDACPFRENAAYLGVPFGTLQWGVSDNLSAEPDCLPNSPHSAAIAVRTDKCVLCGRCRALCNEAGRSFMGISGRGAEARVFVDPQSLHCDSEACRTCRRCLDACPAGALSPTW